MVLGSPVALGCSYDGQFSNPFSESYPGALDVAIATQKAIRADAILKPSSLDGKKGLRRASWWINLLVERYPDQLNGSYIYLVDSQLWSKYNVGTRVTIHVQAPGSAESVVLLSEATLNSLVNHNITLSKAIELGLVRQA